MSETKRNHELEQLKDTTEATELLRDALDEMVSENNPL